MGTATKPVIEVTISPHKMPRRTRNGVLIALGGTLAGAVAAFTWVTPPRDLFSTLLWAVSVGVASALIGLYAAGFVITTTLRIDGEGIRARQWRFTKELAISRVQRIYLFKDGNHEKLAIVPAEGEVWYVGLGLAQSELDAVATRLAAIARERGIEFQRGLTFPEVYEREAQRPSKREN